MVLVVYKEERYLGGGSGYDTVWYGTHYNMEMQFFNNKRAM
jgi:hypothetical protein